MVVVVVGGAQFECNADEGKEINRVSNSSFFDALLEEEEEEEDVHTRICAELAEL